MLRFKKYSNNKPNHRFKPIEVKIKPCISFNSDTSDSSDPDSTWFVVKLPVLR